MPQFPISIVIAAYRERVMIGDVVRSVRAAGHQNVIVVDDGSEDGTSEQALAAGATVLRHIINRGQGAALKTGIEYALSQGAKAVVTFDADGQHDPADISAITAPVIAGNVDVALGSRFLRDGSNVPFLRLIALKGGALLMHVMYGVHLTDSHNGFRAFSDKALQQLRWRSDRMEHASEIISEIGRNRLRYCEVPVTVRYTEHSIKNSKQGTLPALRIAWKMFLHKVLH